MDWNSCFSTRRILSKAGEEKSNHRSPFSRDADRIIFSDPFRRLQDKTQIFSLPGSAFVHNRLTHSLEVASVGRSLGAIAGRRICEIHSKSLNNRSKVFYREELSDVIYAACLAHDIGNPAFGHSGEDAICSFFTNNAEMRVEGVVLKDFFEQKAWTDLTNFEGNANALRILAGERKGIKPWALNPTTTTIATLTKYPCESDGSRGKKGALHRKKFGFLQSEMDLFKALADELNLIRESENPMVYLRHPFVFLLEAADDICYNLVDLEDAARLNIISYPEARDLLGELLDSYGQNDGSFSGKSYMSKDPLQRLSYLRAKCIGLLIDDCANAFVDNAEKIILGKLQTPLIKITKPDTEMALNTIKTISQEKIYNSESVVRMELAGYRIFSHLLELMVPAVLKQKPDGQDKKTHMMIPEAYRPEPDSTPFEKMLCLIDFLSSMTDNYALEIYKNTTGIEMPHH
ncbi:MAG: dNTP triphosphohydrolase [Saprospirales bacterium]|nr:MAG: dNTP triphosphohydrolase [Saprospirales bacterium]